VLAGLRGLPRPLVHADLAAAAALAAAREQRAAATVEVGLVERQRLVNTQPGSPQYDDQRAQPAGMAPVAVGAHDRDGLLHSRRICRIAVSLVARRTAGVEPPASSPASADDPSRRAAVRS
jgi:hypothetical protein